MTIRQSEIPPGRALAGCTEPIHLHAIRPHQPHAPSCQHGFTLVELVMVMIIVGILAVFAAPRFFDADAFKSRGFSDQVHASLRYAQKIAIAQRRFVCVTIAGNSLSLATGTVATCGTPLASSSSGGNYVIDAPASVTVTDASFYFKALGSPSAGVTVSVTGGDMTRNIIVEAETGYVH
ncbi:MAG: type II secretion system protein [Gallionella sp.]|nr:type II secretion system protein [Gallionella sp.]